MQALRLFVVEGKSHDEVAEELHVSRRTACRDIHVARTRWGYTADKANWDERRALNAFLGISPDLRDSPRALEHFHPGALQAVLASLTWCQRRTYWTHFHYELPLRVIAAREGVTVVAVSRRVARILERFREAGIPGPMPISRVMRKQKRKRIISLSDCYPGTY